MLFAPCRGLPKCVNVGSMVVKRIVLVLVLEED